MSVFAHQVTHCTIQEFSVYHHSGFEEFCRKVHLLLCQFEGVVVLELGKFTGLYFS